MTNPKLYLHYLGLAAAMALGAVLRFWHLDLKPLWMDEIITAIFSFGQNYHDLPLNILFPLQRVSEIFTYQSGISCEQIAENLANQSTHPPLFFCAMYRWLGWMIPLGSHWVAKLRSLPAVFGVGTIGAIYFVNRTAFSPTSGIIAALIMAVSPFAVYLSQEARHYTMPMFLITLALLGLMQIQQDIFEQQRIRVWVVILWSIVNSIGFYVHYFFILAFIAEIITLLVLTYSGKTKLLKKGKTSLILVLSIIGVVISFFPWLPVMFSHFQSAETNWLPATMHIAPLYQTLIGWILMVISLPVENQPLLITATCGFLMLSFGIWLGWEVWKGLKLLWLDNKTHLATLTLLSFTIVVLMQFVGIAYLLDKDITVVPRYNFVYYPSFAALLAASISKIHKSKFITLVVGILSCIFVVSNLVLQKPFQPEQVAQKMNLEPSVPLMLVVGYDNYQDVALGLSFALALAKVRGNTNIGVLVSLNNFDSLAFLDKSLYSSAFWNRLNQIPTPVTDQMNLWIVSPGMRKRDYPQDVGLSGDSVCTIDIAQHYRIGVPYQLYRCNKIRQVTGAAITAPSASLNTRGMIKPPIVGEMG
ncbi:glycosyltransferase family 39 protein [Umezakia ovalisporum]|uniref:Glycosyltransferase family 39 protein n=1 Tax=Umezakia ovalisporum FSS-62 TaxID=2971776 RepID=A0AA43GXA3_9CYAN|nr:glycosyltransferase family 39 protein [Umezakia ovalisporum]MDH6063354.1 glycosyltransferase family 39 protein [Umezakia ovalisporum FSS-62]MDH6068713.1 glycosyltransferase family 39 protein [Umezakia ovalisporum APH033B]MDH6103728.1 glycosyltransferase family 39 protein [Umezakia ovalisporum ANA283AFssAo]